MSKKLSAFYRDRKEISVDFSAEGVSSDGAVVLLEKLERKHKLIGRFSRHIPDKREAGKVEHSVEKLLKQRGFTLSRFENSVDKQAMLALCESWVDRYVDSLSGRREITIDIDATDNPTHGNQQLSMFHGFYGQFPVMSSSSMTDKPGRLSCRYCVRAIPIRIDSMSPSSSG